METIISGRGGRSHESLAHKGLRILSFCIMPWKDEPEPRRIKLCLERKVDLVQSSSSQYRTLDTIDGEAIKFEWKIFPGFSTLQLCNKVQELLSRLSDKPEEFTGRIIFTSMFNDI